MPRMPDAPQADDPRPLARLIAAWRSSSDLRFYVTSLVLAADIILVVGLVRAREEPVVPPAVPRPSEAVYGQGSARTVVRATPSSPDPLPAPLTLAQALADLPGDGAPVATVETSRGTLRCTLLADRAPNGVALFVGLARGRRPYWNATRSAWSSEPFYDGSVIYRVVPGSLVEGGGPTLSGAVEPGFTVPVEVPSPHDAPGILSLTQRATLQIAAGPNAALDGNAIIGRCAPAALVDLMTDVRAQGERPQVPIFIRAVRVTRGA